MSARTVTPPVTPETRPRYVLGGGGADGRLVVPAGITGVPPVVRAASDACAKAASDYQQALAEWRAAKAEAQAAGGLDAAADRSALAAGLPMPTDRVRPEAERALGLAQRGSEAAEAEVRQTAIAFARTVQVAREEWLPAAEGVVGDTQAEAIEALGTLAELCDRLVAERGVAAALKQWPGQGSLVNTTFLVSSDQNQAEEKRQRAEAEIRRADAQGFSSRQQIERDMAHLVAAVSIEITGRERYRAQAPHLRA